MNSGKLTYLIFIFAVTVGFASCTTKNEKPPPGYELANAWARLALYITKNTPANSPTFASRCLGYIGLTMYESIVPGFPHHQSVAPQLNGLGKLSSPPKGESIIWEIALNAGQAEILRKIYIQTSDENKSMIDSLEQSYEKKYANSGGKKIKENSIQYGRKIADEIFEWSKTDGGHRAYLHNFDKKIVYVQKPGGWQPPLYAQSFSHFPLHPHWGDNRPFLAIDDSVAEPACLPYDTTPGSAYYKQFYAVYEKEISLTDTEKQAAVWWGDDPDETFTPPGHSYYLATLAIEKTQPEMIRCAETFARVGMAVADAFRDCWKWKFNLFTERPNTFIPKYIDSSWHSFWPDPPFPSFPSGHAIQAAAAATVLTDLYGSKFSFTDSAHAGRKRDDIRNADFVVRHFKSFWEVAEETADSRFFGGIHTPQDNDAGLQKGKEIGKNVNNLRWKKDS